MELKISMPSVIDRIYCISDLHLGGKSKAEDFTGEEFLIPFLETLPANSILVLNGDILELKQFNLEEILDNHGKLLEYLFNRDNLYYVVGNHDIKLSRTVFMGKPVLDKLIIGDTLFIHGHQFDWLNNKHRWMVDIALKFLRWLEEHICKDIDLTLDKLLKYGRWADSDIKYRKMAIETIKSLGLSRVVLGHTHRKAIYHYKDMTYLNSGCWVNGKKDFVSLQRRDING